MTVTLNSFDKRACLPPTSPVHVYDLSLSAIGLPLRCERRASFLSLY